MKNAEKQGDEYPQVNIQIRNLIPISDWKKMRPWISGFSDIKGDIFISWGSHILTRNESESTDGINDAPIYILLELHKIVSLLFETSISWQINGFSGVKFFYNRFALIFRGGGTPPSPIIAMWIYNSEQNVDCRLIEILTSRIGLAETVQLATTDLLSQLLILANEAGKKDKNRIQTPISEFEGEMKASKLYKELTFSYSKTERILNEYRTMISSGMKQNLYLL